MVERKKELRRRRHRRHKLLGMKARLSATKDARDRELILKKIQKLSPLWTEPAKA